MKRLLPFLLWLSLAVFSGCGDGDEAVALTLAEAKAMLQGEWQTTSIKNEEYTPGKSRLVRSWEDPWDKTRLLFSADTVDFNHYDSPDGSLSYSTTEELQLGEVAGTKHLMLRGMRYEVTRLDRAWLQLLLRTEGKPGGNPNTMEQTVTFRRYSR